MRTRSARIVTLSTSIYAFACGGPSDVPPTTPTSAEREGGERHERGGHHHGDMPPATRDFHAVLAPLWHMEKGPERTAKTCGEIGSLREKASATNDADLVGATGALAAECDKPGRPDFDARFAAVHERFHALAER